MTLQSLSDLFLTGMLAYGAPVFGVALFIGAIGMPLPGALLILAAGAFIRLGELDWRLALSLGLAGAAAGDCLGYAVGRWASARLERRLSGSAAWAGAYRLFARRGGSAVLLTRFLITPLGLPVNLIAGGSRYDFRRFFLFVAVGELTWLLLYGALGYAFESQWELINEFAGDFSGLLVGVVLLATGIYFLLRRRPRP